MDLVEAVLKLSQVGSTALLLLALVGAHLGWWVPGWIYRASERRSERWQQLWESQHQITSRALDVAERERAP